MGPTCSEWYSQSDRQKILQPPWAILDTEPHHHPHGPKTLDIAPKCGIKYFSTLTPTHVVTAVKYLCSSTKSTPSVKSTVHVFQFENCGHNVMKRAHSVSSSMSYYQGWQVSSTWWKKLDYTMMTSSKGKHFPRIWPFVRGIHRSPVNSLHKGQ